MKFAVVLNDGTERKFTAKDDFDWFVDHVDLYVRLRKVEVLEE